MVQAFLLAFFSHLITKLLGDLHLALFGPELLMSLFELPKYEGEQEIAAEVLESAKEEIDNGTKAKKKRLDRLRRRRKRSSSRDSSSLDEGNGTCLEECLHANCYVQVALVALETSEAEDFDDSSESEEGEEESEMLASESEDESADNDEDVVVESSRDLLSAKTMVEVLQKQGLNAAIRICALWYDLKCSVQTPKAEIQ
jgi:hypothetical protein